MLLELRSATCQLALIGLALLIVGCEEEISVLIDGTVTLQGDDPNTGVLVRSTVLAQRCEGSIEQDNIECTWVEGLAFNMTVNGVTVPLDEVTLGTFEGELSTAYGSIEIDGPWGPRVCEVAAYITARAEAVPGGMIVVIDPPSDHGEIQAEIRNVNGELHDYAGFDGARLDRVVPVGAGMSVWVHRRDLSLFDSPGSGPSECWLTVGRSVPIP